MDRALIASVVAVVTGAVLGTLLALDQAAEAAPWLRAWIVDRSGARNALATMLGVQITLVTIALSTTTLVYQSLASQYSPRLFGLVSPAAPLYREIPLFAASASYTVAGIRQLGLSAFSGAAPRPVVLGGMLLLLVALTSVLVTIARTFRRLQVDEILQQTRDETFAAARRLARARCSLPADPASPPPASPESTPIVAPKSGYLIGLDLALLDQVARRFDLRVRIERMVGEFVARGEALGWFRRLEGSRPALAGKTLARGVLVDGRRSSFLDVGFGLRVLADIADRALSPGINDPTTARQCLHQMRAVLRELVAMPMGDAALVNDRGEIYVSAAMPRFQDYLATALDGPSHYGAGDADVIAEILDLALEVGRAADHPERRAAVRKMAARAVADATHRGEIDETRLAVLRDKERAVALALQEAAPPPQRCPENERRDD